MLDEKGFDLWADGYDRSVGISDEENTYPFAGYREVLGEIFRIITEKPAASVLDLGFGTGVLTARLYEAGCTVYGQDFSREMLRQAVRKMPGAHLFEGDFSKGLAEELVCRQYDFITATYSLHHLTDEAKIKLLRDLQGLLCEDGRILIGDVAFSTRREMERCREETGDEWDDDEYYFAADEFEAVFPGLSFRQVSFCAGILTLPRDVSEDRK